MDIDLERVTKATYSDWYTLYNKIFYKQEDRYPKEIMEPWVLHSLSYFILLDKKRGGIIFQGIDKNRKSAMIYYIGLDIAYRGKGIFPAVFACNTENLERHGVSLLILESENPAYARSESEQITSLKRLKSFIEGCNVTYISPLPVPYLRSATLASGEDPHHGIQENYLLGFTRIGREKNEYIPLLTKEHITRKEYLKLFELELYLEKGIESLSEGIKQYRAAKEFSERLSLYTLDTFPLLTKRNWKRELSPLLPFREV